MGRSNSGSECGAPFHDLPPQGRPLAVHAAAEPPHACQRPHDGGRTTGTRAITQQMIAARFDPEYMTSRSGLHQSATRRLRTPGPTALQARPLRNDRRADVGLACEDGSDESRILEGTVAPDPRRTREGRAAPSRRLPPELLSARRSRRPACPEAALPGSGRRPSWRNRFPA